MATFQEMIDNLDKEYKALVKKMEERHTILDEAVGDIKNTFNTTADDVISSVSSSAKIAGSNFGVFKKPENYSFTGSISSTVDKNVVSDIIPSQTTEADEYDFDDITSELALIDDAESVINDVISSISTDIVPDINTKDLDFVVDDVERYKVRIWESPELDSLEQTLLDALNNGRLISQDMYELVFGDQPLRRADSTNYALNVLRNTRANRSFTLPTSYSTAQDNIVNLFLNQHNKNDSDVIFILLDQHAQNTFKFAAEKLVDINAMHADFTYQYSAIYNNIIDALLQQYETVATVGLEKFQTKFKYYDEQVKTALNVAESSIKAAENKVTWESKAGELKHKYVLAKYKAVIEAKMNDFKRLVDFKFSEYEVKQKQLLEKLTTDYTIQRINLEKQQRTEDAIRGDYSAHATAEAAVIESSYKAFMAALEDNVNRGTVEVKYLAELAGRYAKLANAYTSLAMGTGK